MWEEVVQVTSSPCLSVFLQVVLKAVYLVLNHDISSRICDVALNIVECLLQLGVVPCVEKNRKKSENKENETMEKRASEGTFQFKGVSGSSTCGFGGPSASGAGDGGEEGGGGDGGGGGGGGGGPYEKNEKNQEKVRLKHLLCPHDMLPCFLSSAGWSAIH